MDTASGADVEHRQTVELLSVEQLLKRPFCFDNSILGESAKKSPPIVAKGKAHALIVRLTDAFRHELNLPGF